MDEYIEVDYYFCGVYTGKRKIEKNSICGMLMTGNYSGAVDKTKVLVDELNTIPRVSAKAELMQSTSDCPAHERKKFNVE